MRRRCLLPTVLLLLAGCAPEEAAEPVPFLVISGPKEFLSLQLEDSSQRVVWRLVADPASPLDRLVYGRVPPGFRQESPAGGQPPRRLTVGEPLTLESVTPIRTFRHRGRAGIGQRFMIEGWEMRLAPADPGAAAGPGLGAAEGTPVRNPEEEVKP